MSLDRDFILSHYGVKGQQWGVRRKSSSGVSKSISKRGHSTKTKSTNPTHHLSDQELQNAVNRLHLERQYHTLTSTKQSHASTVGKQMVGNALKQHGTKLISVGLAAATTAIGTAFVAKFMSG